MFSKHSSYFIVLLVLTFFIISCDSSSQKTEFKESTVPTTKAKAIEAPPLTTTVKVTGGTIEGVEQDDIFSYKGIPFAAPPVGELRWKAPVPMQPWTGVQKADAFCGACMQASRAMGNTAPVSEDCLYLNVWTPAKKTDEKIPVIYWVHGGGYSGGSTSTPMYDGTGFAKKGVVLVSVAYRLGPFGFLAHPELSRESGHGSGSYGMQDMIAGLKWVKENIARFGGDPSNVTIFGHSAGGAAISLLAASPLTKGLFHRAICMSGGSFTPLQTSKQTGMGLRIPALRLAESTGEEFLKELGVADIKEARALSAEDIQNKMAGGPEGMRFRPVADGYVISDDLYSLFQAGRFNDTPILLGHTSDEMGSFGRMENKTPDEFEEQIKSQYGPHADAILGAYPHSTDAEATKAAKDIRNDSSFSWNTWTWSRLQSQKGKGKAFQYYFDYHPNSPDGGSGHGSDVPHAFQTLGGPMGAPKEEDLKLSDMISSYWVNFARSGDPNDPDLPEWPAFSEDDQKVMVFDTTPSARSVPNIDKLKVFDAYFAWIREQVSNGPAVLPADTPLGTGPFKAIMEVDPTLANHTVYRPNDMSAVGSTKLPIMAWGNGACAADGNAFRLFLTEIASHGYLIIANGPIGPDRAQFPPEIPPSRGTPPESDNTPSKPAVPRNMMSTPPTTTAQLIEAIDWAIVENGRQGSKYYDRLDTTKIAMAGMSCGGVQAIEASVDPRVTTTIVANSGLMPEPTMMSGSGKPVPKESLNLMHAPVLYISGDDSDIAFANANDDFEKINHIPVFRTYQKEVGHGGTYHDPDGGTFSKVTLSWLDWLLKGDKEAAKMFQGDKCGLCTDPKWVVVGKKKID